MSKNEDKRKGILGAIWESMTKTGGCCGPGESCGCSPKADDDKSKNGFVRWIKRLWRQYIEFK